MLLRACVIHFEVEVQCYYNDYPFIHSNADIKHLSGDTLCIELNGNTMLVSSIYLGTHYALA